MKPPIYSEASQLYAIAHEALYVTKDLREALLLYEGIMSKWSAAPENDQARAQIANIFNRVVPKPVIAATQLKLALDHLG